MQALYFYLYGVIMCIMIKKNFAVPDAIETYKELFIPQFNLFESGVSHGDGAKPES